MNRRAGSWPLLVGGSAAFLAAFTAVRARSSFLAIEQAPAAARALAGQHGLLVADVFALHELLGVDAAEAALATATTVFAAARGRFGEPLAAILAVDATGPTTAAIEAALQAAGNPTAAWQSFAVTPAALTGRRFLEVRRRFAERAAARD